MANTVETRDLAAERMAKLFRGLGDPSRLAILAALRDGPRNVSDLVEATGLSQSNASTHLHCLWCCGLVTKRKQGRFVYYAMRSKKVQAVLDHADRLLGEVGLHIDACGSYGGPLEGAGRKSRPAKKRNSR
jgi:DNA-binding transcriptional ArsR family regulator